MRKLAIITFLTLDGVMQAPMSPLEDTSGEFEQGGWAAPYYSGVMNQVENEAMGEPYDMLFGRKTYDAFASHWPHVGDENPVAAMMNRAKKYVATSSPGSLTWQNSTPLNGEIATEIIRLKNQDGPLLQVHGSWRLVQTLIDERLVDEFRLWTFPVVVGSGKRLFDSNMAAPSLELIKSEASSNGVVMSLYRSHAPGSS